MAALTPTAVWSQRDNTVLFKVELPDVKNQKLNVDPSGKLHFEGESSGKNYALDIELHGGINVEESKFGVRARNVEFLLQKAEAGWWPRLLKAAGKQHWLKVDWQTWKDEDEADDDFDAAGMNSMGMGGMPGMPGMGGMGGGGFDMNSLMGGMGGGAGMPDMSEFMDEDEDDEKVPDLEDDKEPKTESTN